MAAASAVAFSRLVDNETIFYVDIGNAFFFPTVPTIRRCGGIRRCRNW